MIWVHADPDLVRNTVAMLHMQEFKKKIKYSTVPYWYRYRYVSAFISVPTGFGFDID
jgi:hypothetical protein